MSVFRAAAERAFAGHAALCADLSLIAFAALVSGVGYLWMALR